MTTDRAVLLTHDQFDVPVVDVYRIAEWRWSGTGLAATPCAQTPAAGMLARTPPLLPATGGRVRTLQRSTILASTALLVATPGEVMSQTMDPWTRVSLIEMPYTGSRNVPELSDNPAYLYRNGIADSVRAMGFELAPHRVVSLTAEDEQEYGEWHRMGLANGHLADMVAENRRQHTLTVGLLGNCTSLLGVLGGLQHSGDGDELLDVGLVFIDSHGDFNVPETTLSGMLGGMPVAVAAGMALHNLRGESGLGPAIPTESIVMGAVRDLDPLERELVEESDIQHLSTEDLATRPDRVRAQIERLARSNDVIYVHVDMDVLDPREVPGHPLTVPNGPTSEELASALIEMFAHPKVVALGVASTPANERDLDGLSLRAAYNLIEGALEGVRGRNASD
jgi:arginase